MQINVYRVWKRFVDPELDLAVLVDAPTARQAAEIAAAMFGPTTDHVVGYEVEQLNSTVVEP